MSYPSYPDDYDNPDEDDEFQLPVAIVIIVGTAYIVCDAAVGCDFTRELYALSDTYSGHSFISAVRHVVERHRDYPHRGRWEKWLQARDSK